MAYGFPSFKTWDTGQCLYHGLTPILALNFAFIQTLITVGTNGLVMISF